MHLFAVIGSPAFQTDREELRRELARSISRAPVSYTHLDVYKRQEQQRAQQDAQKQEQQRVKQQAQQQDQQHAQQEAQKQEQQRGGQSGPSGRPVPDGRRLPPVAVDAATSVLPRGDHKSFDIRHKNADGSQIVLSQRFLPNGTKQVTGFKQTEDTRDGTVTRFYADGRRVTQGRDFERRSVGNGPDFVTWHNGLREACLLYTSRCV